MTKLDSVMNLVARHIENALDGTPMSTSISWGMAERWLAQAEMLMREGA